MNKELANHISKLVNIDQGIRKSWFKKREPVRNLYNYLMHAIDGVHNYYIHKIIKTYGFPTRRQIGKKGMRNFWLLVQHQDLDVELQKACLEHCDFEPKEQAYLTDRILVNSGEKQLYGTQFYKNKMGALIPKPVKDKRNLDTRRKKAGLEPFQKYKEKIRKDNH